MIGIVVLATVLRCISLTQSFWLDEAAQATISSHSLLNVNWAADFQPPLFYVLTNLWQQLGIREEWFLRLLPVFFGVATVCITYYFFKKLFNEKVGIITSILLATAPYHIYFSQEYRMYSFFTFLAILSWLFLWEKRWVWYSLTIVLALYIHYFAFLLIISQLIYIAVSRKITIYQYIVILISAFIPFLFWVPMLLKQFQTARHLISVWPDWRVVSGVPFLKFPFLLLAKFTVGVTSPPKAFYSLAVIIVGGIFLLTLISLLYSLSYQVASSRLHVKEKKKKPETRHSEPITLLLCYFLIPLLLAWIGGLWVLANGPWRLLFVLPAFYGIIVVGTNVILSEATFSLHERGEAKVVTLESSDSKDLSRMRVSDIRRRFFIPLRMIQNDNIGKLFIVLVVASNIIFSFYYLFFPKNHRENWREAVKYSDEKVGAAQRAPLDRVGPTGRRLLGGGVVLSEYVGPWATMVWYTKKPERYIGAALSLPITAKSVDQQFNNVTIQQFNNIVLYTYLFQLSDPNKLAESYLSSEGYKLSEEKDFKGVGIVKYFVK